MGERSRLPLGSSQPPARNPQAGRTASPHCVGRLRALGDLSDRVEPRAKHNYTIAPCGWCSVKENIEVIDEMMGPPILSLWHRPSRRCFCLWADRKSPDILPGFKTHTNLGRGGGGGLSAVSHLFCAWIIALKLEWVLIFHVVGKSSCWKAAAIRIHCSLMGRALRFDCRHKCSGKESLDLPLLFNDSFAALMWVTVPRSSFLIISWIYITNDVLSVALTHRGFGHWTAGAVDAGSVLQPNLINFILLQHLCLLWW